MKRIFTKTIGFFAFFILFFANVQGQQDTVYIYQKGESLYKRDVHQVDSIRYTKPSGNNTLNIYYKGSIVYNKAVKDIDSIMFYEAKRPIPSYTISFNGNGHTSGTAPASIKADSGTVIVVPVHGNLSKKGHDFIEWNTQSDGLGMAYAVAANITLKSALTLYAQWKFDPTFIVVDTTFIVNGVSFNMIYVQGGTFTMGCTGEQGSDCEDVEKPSHTVILSDYYIGELELTQGLWKAVMGANNNPSHYKGDSLPVEQVSWGDCQVFIKALNALTGKTFSLPTEAQWEYAARGGHKSKGYKYAGSHTLEDVAWYVKNSDENTHKVGTKSANELGIYDMSGNVWEWCNDWYGGYTAEAQTNPMGPSSGSGRVLRGGSWYGNAQLCRVSRRYSDSPDYRGRNIGFRLVLVNL